MTMKLGYNDPDYALGEAPLAPSVPKPQSSRKSSTPAPAAPAAPVAPTSTTAPGMSWEDFQGYLGSNWNDNAWNNTDLVRGFEGLAQHLGVSGPAQERTGRQIGAGFINEGGSENLIDEWGPSSGLSSALSGYRFSPSMDSDQNPTMRVYDPSGTQIGDGLRIGSSPGSFSKFMSMAIPALVTGGFGAALAPLALGAAGLGGAAGAGGLSAATLNATASGMIGNTLNTARQGGDLQDYLKGIGTAAVMPAIGQGIGAGINAIAPGATSGVTDALQSAGLSEGVAADLAEYTKPVLKGAVTGAFKGDILGGVTDSVLGQITRDVAPSLGLTEPQARALFKWGRDQDTSALVMSLGPSLAKQAMGSVQDAAKQQGIEQAYNDPSRALDALPEGARDYTPETYDPNAPVTGGTDFDLNALLSTLPYEVQNSALGIDLGQSEPLQQTVIRGEKPPKDDLSDLIGIGGGYGGNPPPISHGQTPQKIVIPGKKLVPPEDDLLDLLPYNYTIPELPLLEPPKVEIEKPTAPPIGGGPTTPTTPDKEFDLNSILNLLGGGGQEPVLSQVLAQMPGFDVESMSQYLREQRRKKAPDQQTQLAELFANIGYRG